MPLRVVFAIGGREADVEPARTQADGQRGEEVAGLVDEDEERETEDRDEEEEASVAHAVPIFPPRGSGLLVGLDQLLEIARRRTVERAERVLDERRDLEEADPTGEERRHGDLVRRVEGARIRAAALARLACEPEERESLEVGRLELELEPCGEVERGTGVARRSGIGERERDRDAHVRVPEMRERGAVAEADDRVHDRGRVHDDLDPRRSRGRRGSAPR